MQKRPALLVMLLILAGVVGAAAHGAAAAEGAPEVYNHITESGAALDRLVHQTYDGARRVIDIPARDGAYTPPRLKSGAPPGPVLDAKGAAIQGKVILLFIVEKDGHVQDPVIVQASDPRLGSAAIAAVGGWLFEPARFNGRVAAVTGGEEFNFAP